jgi:dTMP kinase
MKNPFIVIEALDAGGSQTQTDLLVKRLAKEGFNPLQLHFPQEDRATGQFVYQKFLFAKGWPKMSRREQSLIYIQDFFSRCEDLWKIKTGKDKKALIVSDRFCTSTMAYQTIGLTGRDRQNILKWITWLCFEGQPALPKPDVVVFLDTPVKVSMNRLKDKKKDFFETAAKLKAIRASYLRIAQEQKWVVVQSVDDKGVERTRPDLHEEIWQQVQSLVG